MPEELARIAFWTLVVGSGLFALTMEILVRIARRHDERERSALSAQETEER